jgi:gas vesicle protein
MTIVSLQNGFLRNFRNTQNFKFMSNNNKFIAGLVLGAAAGAAIAMLLATKEGQELLNDFSETATKFGKRVKDVMEDAGDKVDETIEKGKGDASDLYERRQNFNL